MNLGRAERIDGADCWKVHKVPGGLASFPTYSVDFDQAGMTEFHPVHCAQPCLLTLPSHSLASTRLWPCPSEGCVALADVCGVRWRADMFNHPQVKNPTHYCYGILDNGPAGLVLGSLFQRHFFMTIDRVRRCCRLSMVVCFIVLSESWRCCRRRSGSTWCLTCAATLARTR